MVRTLSTASLMALAACLAFTEGHMMMRTPVPYGKATLNNSPLSATGEDFPCKQRAGVYDPPSQPNIMAIGEPQTLNFIGGATHGGGSCQVSLTTDKEPTKDSKWQVIHSIEGGCPANVDGNLSDDAAGTGADEFQFTIPAAFKPGEYTLAWTWFNKIGQREMYMNCAPITVTGPKKKRYAPSTSESVAKRDGDFPTMAIANIGLNTCKTDPANGIYYPIKFGQPGASVQRIGDNFMPMVGEGCEFASVGNTTASTGGDAATPTSSGPVASSPAGGAAPSVTVTPPAESGSASGSFATPAAGSNGTGGTATSSDSDPSTGSASTTTTGGSAGAATENTACTQEGATQCAGDGNSYTICASGQWVKMPVAAGTKCSGTGVQANLNIVAAGKAKRQSHAHGHIHRRSF